MRPALASVSGFVLWISAGCAQQPVNETREAVCAPTQSFHAVSNGWHTGVIVRREDLLSYLPALGEDFDTAEMLELGWGDTQYYHDPQAGAADAIRAIGWPTRASMHVYALPDSPARAFAKDTLIELHACDAGYRRMLERIAASFETQPDGAVRREGPGLYGKSYFYAATGRFHAFNTCNTWAARTIAASGYPVSDTTVLTADALVGYLRAGQANE